LHHGLIDALAEDPLSAVLVQESPKRQSHSAAARGSQA
jgi:hypothetical protein